MQPSSCARAASGSRKPVAPHTVISANRISDERYGIVTLNAVQLSGLPSNKYDSSVAVPVSVH
jgi:hypothetical protein